MDVESQIRLLTKEKEIALHQWDQSKLLIEKLEQELSTSRENNGKNIINIVQKEYADIINVLHEKITTLQNKYKEEICNSNTKDDEIKILNRRTENLNSKLQELEKQHLSCHNLLKQEREKYLTLENDFIIVQNKLFNFEKKYPCVKILEDERDKLIQENNKLSNDCNELELALEICHQKIRSLEDDINQCYICINKIKNDRELANKNEKTEKEIVLKLEKKIEEMVENEKLKFQKIKEDLKLLSEQFSLNRILKDSRSIEFDENSIDINLIEIYILLKRYREKLKENIREKNSLEINIEKYKTYIKEANNKISSLEKEFKKKVVADRLELQKYLNKIEFANVELKKQICSQEELHKKWKKEVLELISRFKHRILNLNSKFKHVQKENLKLKKYVNHFLKENRSENP